jgi:hypothetical protein
VSSFSYRLIDWASSIPPLSRCIFFCFLLLIPLVHSSARENKVCGDLFNPQALRRLRTVCVDTSFLEAGAASDVKAFLAMESVQMRLTATKIARWLSADFRDWAVVPAGILIEFTVWILCWGAGTRASGFMPHQNSDDSGQDYYQGAFTLIDLPSEDLVGALPELSGLHPSGNQLELPRLLSEVGEGVKESYQKYTEIVADEQVTQLRCGPTGRLRTTAHQAFRYLIVSSHQAGQERIEEYRIGIDGKPVQGGEAGPSFTTGFASMWALFYPGDQPGSRFRYPGLQQFGEHLANVIGFAQDPHWAFVKGLEHVGPQGQPIVVFYQGVAWCDRATNKILKMRTDLLKPRLDVKLELLITEIDFGEVHFSDAAFTSAWVPLRVTVSTAWNGQVFRDEHLYSNYRLPGSTSKIEAAPKETAPPSKPN